MSRTGLAALIAANLFVAVQILRYDWGYYNAILIFWLEAVILGGYNVLRLMVVGVAGAAPFGSWVAGWLDLGSGLNRLILTLIGVGFFVVKFGAFALIIGIFVILLPATLSPEGSAGARTIQRALSEGGPGLLWTVGALCLSHGVSFVRNFLMDREYDRLNILFLVFWPYARMTLVAGVLLIGIATASLVPGLGRETTFAVVMVLLKTGVDALSHFVEHCWFTVEQPPIIVDRRVTTS